MCGEGESHAPIHKQGHFACTDNIIFSSYVKAQNNVFRLVWFRSNVTTYIYEDKAVSRGSDRKRSDTDRLQIVGNKSCLLWDTGSKYETEDYLAWANKNSRCAMKARCRIDADGRPLNTPCRKPSSLKVGLLHEVSYPNVRNDRRQSAKE